MPDVLQRAHLHAMQAKFEFARPLQQLVQRELPSQLLPHQLQMRALHGSHLLEPLRHPKSFHRRPEITGRTYSIDPLALAHQIRAE